MKIVILDGYIKNPGDLSWEMFEALGELKIYDMTPSENKKLIRERIGDAEAVLVSDTCLGRDTMEACPSIRYIGVLSTGYNIVDLEAAKERGISVSNIPAYGTYSVSQGTIALLLEICNRAGHHSASVKGGHWSSQPYFCFWDYPLIELAGKIMGVIGFGRIGQRTAAIAGALGMKILFYDTTKRPELETKNCRQTDFNSLLMKSDVVSQEPIQPDNPLLMAKNCIITPHIAWAAKESRERLLKIAAENLTAFINGNPVNLV